LPWSRFEGYNIFIPSDGETHSTMSDPVQIALDVLALVAFIVFAGLSMKLAKSMKGSALRRGFSFASTAGVVHIVGNLLNVMGDFGIVSASIPLIAFSVIQALFAILLALAVQSFFPSWYKAFKKSSGNPPLPGFGQ